MRITVDGVKYGVSFKHTPGPAGRLAREVVAALTPPPEPAEPGKDAPKLAPVDLERIADVIQHVFDRHAERRRVVDYTGTVISSNTMLRAGRRLRAATTTCTIWKGEKRPWDDTTKELIPGAEDQILVSYAAECSVNDHFNRASGRKVAFMKALGPNGLKLTASDRKKWRAALTLAYDQLRKHSRDVAATKAAEGAVKNAKKGLATPEKNA